MAIMVANGANSASLSPIGPTGIIVNGIMEKMGMPAVVWQNYLIVLAAHAIVAFSGYLIFGGWRLFRSGAVLLVLIGATDEAQALRTTPWGRFSWSAA